MDEWKAVEMTLQEQYNLLTELNKRNLARVHSLEAENAVLREGLQNAADAIHSEYCSFNCHPLHLKARQALEGSLRRRKLR